MARTGSEKYTSGAVDSASRRSIQLHQQFGTGSDLFQFDAAHLGRYYQLTGDENAKLALQRMAEWANAATISGQLTVFSSPWWKHFMGTGGPYTGFEHVAAVTENPLALDLMRQRRSYIQPYVWTYGNMYAWKKRAPGKKVSRDRCMFDRNANGPALRIGALDVEMPSRPWGDSQFGMGVSNEKGWTSCFNAVYVAIPGKRNGHMTYLMIPPDEYRQHDGVVGRNWIAGGGTLSRAPGNLRSDSAGIPVPPTDLWYADENGAAGVISLVMEKKTKLPGVEIWVSSGMAKISNRKKTNSDLPILPCISAERNCWNRSGGEMRLRLL